MNKKTKWAIPFAVLALSCGIAAGCSGGHEHSYTEWGYNETQHWKECPDDNEIDESSKANHNFVDGSCECGATVSAVTDVTITNGTTDTNGTVTLSKTTAKKGDSVTVTVAPKEGYQLKSLTVNGTNVFGVMTGNTYEFTVSEDTTVIAVFEKIASSSVNAQITGKKYGITGNSLTAGTEVTLSATGRDDIVTEIKAVGDNLVIEVDEIAGDNWSVKADGYIASTIVIPRDAEYNTAIALEYDLMENLKATWGNSDSVDLSKQNEGKITHTGGYVQWVSSKNSYESVAITATVGKGGYRQGVFIRFKGETYDDDKYVMVSKENEQKIGWCAMGGGSDYKGGAISPWDDKIQPLTKDEYELTLVRDGADIYFFVDGEYIDKKTFSDYADKEGYVGLFCTDATAMENSERTFAIQDASEFLVVSVTDETTDTNGTVTIDKTTANLNEEVTVTLTADQGYKIKDLTVNGQSVLNDLHSGVYKFNALKDTVIVAEFEENRTVDGVEVTVNAATGFVAEGATLTFEQLGEKQTGTVGANGKVTLGSAEKPVALGTHNVYADFGGYKISLGTVTVETPESGTTATAEVTLGFTGSGVEYAGSVSSANPATGEFTYKLGKEDNGAYNNKYDIKAIENGGYFAQKISFAAMANEIGTGKKVSMSVILRTTTGKEIKFVVQNSNQYFGLDGKFCMGLDDDSLGGGNGIFVGADASKFVNLDGYKDALLGDGLWIVLGYDAQTGGLVTYAGTSLESMLPVKTWGTLPTGLKFNGFGTGKWFDNGSNADLVKVTLKYGETMTDIGMSVREQVDVTCSVNDDAMGDIKLDAAKYYPGTECTVTVTAKAGYYLESIKVGSNTAVTAGWTQNGLVYTYKFNVPEGGAAVVATLKASPTIASATVTVNAAANFVADGAELTFECNGKSWTGTVSDNKVTLGSASNPVVLGTHSVYTVVNGLTVNLGTVEIGTDGAVTLSLDGNSIFAKAESAAAGYDLSKLEITLDLKNDGNAYHNKLVTSVPESNTNYVLYKLSLPEAMKTKLTENGGKKLNLSMPIVVNGSETTVKFVMQNGEVKYQLYGDAIRDAMGDFWGTERTLDAAYWTALTAGDGFYFVANLDKTSNKLNVYFGTELDDMYLADDWGKYNSINTIGISMGNAVDVNGLDAGDQVTVTVSYGKSMEELGIALSEA